MQLDKHGRGLRDGGGGAQLPAPDALDLTRGGHIRCPKCKWAPRSYDLWSCLCGCSWNTFTTNGVCPACSMAWTETQCIRGGEWSPHADWYESPGEVPPSGRGAER